MDLLPALASSVATLPTAVPATPSPLSGPSLLGSLLALILVLGLILGLAWLLRRLPGHGQSAGGGLRAIASLSIGAKERLLVVEVGGEQLLIGVSPGGVSLLHKLPQPLPENTGVAFPALLARRVRGLATDASDKERAA